MTSNLPPHTFTAWRLLLTTHVKLIDSIDQQLTDAGEIPLHWYDVLIELYEAPARRLRMSDLAERVLLTRSGLTRLVDRLEKEGYLTREIDPEDRRGFYATLTESGIDAMRRAWRVYSEGIVQGFGQHISEEEAEVLVKVFTRILDHLR